MAYSRHASLPIGIRDHRCGDRGYARNFPAALATCYGAISGDSRASNFPALFEDDDNRLHGADGVTGCRNPDECFVPFGASFGPVTTHRD